MRQSSNGDCQKSWLHWELEKGRGVGKKSLRQAEQKVETLGDTLAKVKVRWGWTPTAKN